MTVSLLRVPVLWAAFLLILPVSAAAPPDPLPEGAKARLGTPRLRDTSSWSGAALTPDGQHLVGYTQKGFAKFDVVTGDPAGPVGPRAGTGFVGGRVEITADGKRGLNVTFNGANVWEVGTGRPLAKLDRRLPYGDYAVAASADGGVVAVGGSRDILAKEAKPVTALVWDVAKNDKRAEIAVLQNESASVALSPDGKLLATWGGHSDPNPPKEGAEPAVDPGKTIQFWDTETGKELARVRTEGYGSPGVVFAPDGQIAAVGHGGGAVRLIEPKTGKELRRLFGRSDQGVRIAFSPDGKLLATGGTDGTVQLWGVADGARLGVVDPPIGPLPSGLRGLRFAAPDRAVVWGVVGFTAVVWEAPSGKLLSPRGGHVGGLRSVAFGADGKELLSGGEDGLLLRWDVATGKEVGDVRLFAPGGFGPTGRFSTGAVQITADGKTAVTDRGGQGVYDVATGRQTAAPLSGTNTDARPHLCADARTLLLVPGIPFPPKPQPKSLKIGVWDVLSGVKLAEVETPVGELTAAAVTPDRSKLITAVTTRPAADGKSEFLVTGWDLTGGKKLGELAQPGGYGTVYLTPAPDNTSALVATPEGKLVVVDVAAGKAVKEIDTDRQRLTAPPAFGPGGKQFALGFGTGFGPSSVASIQVYDQASGKPVRTFRGHTAAATCLAFSPDGKTLATGGHDTTVLLWDVGNK